MVWTLVVISLLVFGGFLSVNFSDNNNASAAILYVGGSGGGNYTTIQAAISAANSGDTIYVYNGTYNENLNINKRLILIGEDNSTTKIKGTGGGDVIYVASNKVVIKGFTINNSGTNNWDAGIEINYANSCRIENCNISNNGKHGILFYYSPNNFMINNYVALNDRTGMLLYYSNNNQLLNNTIFKNGFGFQNQSWNNSGIYLDHSHNTTITGNSILNHQDNGISIAASNNNLLTYNTFQDNLHEIYWNLNDTGNQIYLNNFNKFPTISGSSSFRTWNSSKPLSYIYNNTNFTSYLGNYWGDYSGSDNNGNGVGETSYYINPGWDYFPLMKPFQNYRIIPSTIKAQMNETSFKRKYTTVSLNMTNATQNATISGDFNGTINITNLKIVLLTSSSFSGKGFFRSNWSAVVDSKPYTGIWQGMLYKDPKLRKMHLKGVTLGGLQGITEGVLLESSKGSGTYNLYTSNWTISYLGPHLTFAQLMLNGSVSYQQTKPTTAKIYILQSSLKGTAAGYYNASLDIVLTHVRIKDNTCPYDGEGFSIITYTSKYGTGQGWTYDKKISTYIVKQTGFFTKPLWGIIFCELYDTGQVRKLTISIVRVDIGLPPRPILEIVVWGPLRVSPGQKANYFVEYRNIGLKPALNTDINLTLSNKTTHISNTPNGKYDSNKHEITWRRNISAASMKTVRTKCKIKWGISMGTKLLFIGYIQDYLENKTLALDTFISNVTPARDPNYKYGFEGNVSPGQQLNFTIEYENEGLGIAFGVYFTDTLSEFLDDTTLTIGPVISVNNGSEIAPAGAYNPETRTISWFVGEVGPAHGGYANISVNVSNSVSNGDEIINYGIVYFPSVPEITRTNGIVSMVRINQLPTAKANAKVVVKTLESVLFDGSGSLDSDGIIENYTWEFGDGEFGFGQMVSHVFLDNDNYIVRLTVIDNDGGEDSHQISVRVENRPPKAMLEVNTTAIYVNEKVTFNASQSTDLDGTVLDYYFDFGDGENSGWITDTSIEHVYKNGRETFNAKLSVRDDDGTVNVNIAEANITVTSRGPTANLTADKLEAMTYENIIFDATYSKASAGYINQYFFDFGDGSDSGWTSTPEAVYQYTDGTRVYTARLTVKDDEGLTDTAEFDIKINNRNPTAEAGINQVTNTNHAIEFDGSSSSDMDGKLKTFIWDFGDGAKDTGMKVSHAYKDDGQYTVTLTVTDDNGAEGVDTCLITVNNVKPVAGFTVTPEEGNLSTIFKFTSTSYDTDGAITKYSWAFGDGIISDLSNPTHQYKAIGTYSIILYVQDDDSALSDTFGLKVTVANQPPIAIAHASATTAKAGEEITFDARESYDPDGTIINYKWNFGDSGTAYGESVKHSYFAQGSYTVTLVILDDAQKQVSTTLEITILKTDIDSDGDDIPDSLDPDDDNDGMPDVWELKYGLDPTDHKDAQIDIDIDQLYNLDEFLHNTDPKNPDTDGEGLLDGQEVKIYKTNASNPDTDGDTYNDKIDAYPLDPTRHALEAEDRGWKLELPFYLILLIIIIIIIIIALIPAVVRKRRRGMIGRPYTEDKTLHELSQDVLSDSDGVYHSISRAQLQRGLESKFSSGTLSEQTYKYIRNDLLYTEYDLTAQEGQAAEDKEGLGTQPIEPIEPTQPTQQSEDAGDR
jgi:parallel beta-helix repeat protein